MNSVSPISVKHSNDNCLRNTHCDLHNLHCDQIHCDQMLHKIKCVKTDPGLTREETFRENHDSSQTSQRKAEDYCNISTFLTTSRQISGSAADMDGSNECPLLYSLALHRSSFTYQVK